MFLFKRVGLGGEEKQLVVGSLQLAECDLGIPGVVGEDIFKAAAGKHIIDEGIAANGYVGVTPDEITSWELVVCSW